MRRTGLLALAAALLLGGCGQPKTGAGETPEATFEAFDTAMRAGSYAAAAGLLDYDALAQAANSDWDSFPSGQQHQITTKMREDAAGRLAAMGYPATGMTVSGTVIAGARATLAAAGGGQSLKLTLAQTEAGWQIVAGLPTMTTE